MDTPYFKNTDIRERDIEQRLVREVGLRGGRAFKWASPSNRGVPDRIVILPGWPKPVFVECKAPKKKPGKLQSYVMEQLAGLGQRVWVVDSAAAIEELLNGGKE